MFPLLEEKVTASESEWLNVAGIVGGFTAGLCFMFYVKSIAEDGPQYQEEIIPAQEREPSSFVGLDDVLDEVLPARQRSILRQSVNVHPCSGVRGQPTVAWR